MLSELRRWSVGLCGIVLLGCADGTTLPAAKAAPFPRLETSAGPPEGAPPEFNEMPAIYNYYSETRLPSGTVVTSGVRDHALVYASMVLFGNWAKHDITTRRTGNNDPLSEEVSFEEPLFPVPWRHQYESGAYVHLPKTCGFTVSGTVRHSTAHVLPVTGGLIRWGDVVRTSWATPESQSDCAPCKTATPIREVVYDPYDPYSGSSGEDGDCNDGSGGSGGADGSGSGTQYVPGDYTGEETVSWTTGQGNGGASACGTAAQVQYVCIDTWDEASGKWVQWDCGYVTTC